MAGSDGSEDARSEGSAPSSANPQEEEPVEASALPEAILRADLDACLALASRRELPGLNEVHPCRWRNGVSGQGTVLYLAAQWGREDLARAILARPDFHAVNAKAQGWGSALRCAAYLGHAGICRAILEHPSAVINLNIEPWMQPEIKELLRRAGGH